MQIRENADFLKQPFALTVLLFSCEAADFKPLLLLKQHFTEKKHVFFF